MKKKAIDIFNVLTEHPDDREIRLVIAKKVWYGINRVYAMRRNFSRIVLFLSPIGIAEIEETSELEIDEKEYNLGYYGGMT
jgi:hypothetical protein